MNTVSIYRTPEGEKTVMALYDTALKNWAVPYQTQPITTRSGDTFVLACGDKAAPPMVLLHGAGTNSSIWAGDVIEYSRHYRVYTVDLPGEPGKSAPVYMTWQGSAWAEWLSDVFDALNIELAVLAGISQGAWTALKFAVERPERVEKLVLITPGGVVPDRLSFIVRAIFWSLFGARGMRRIVRGMFGSQPVPDGVEDMVLKVSQAFKPRIGILPLFTDDDLRRLTMPVLLLGGDQDILRDLPKIAARMQALLSHLQVTLLPGGGHALLNTTGEVMAFLNTPMPGLA